MRPPDPRWHGTGIWREDKSLPLTAYIIVSKTGEGISGRFTGPNLWFERADAERYLKARRWESGEVKEVLITPTGN